MPRFTSAQTESGLFVSHTRVPADAVTSCIGQIAERGQDGQQSCFLTSALNGLVMRNTITTEQAGSAQEQLAQDPRYSQMWVPSHGFTAWRNDANLTGRAINSVLGTDVSLREAPASELGTALADGHVVVATSNLHARAVYQSDEGTVICNPARIDEARAHNLSQLPGVLHEADRNIVII